MYDIAFEDVSKRFDDGVLALDHLNLTIEGGEFFSIVGPSGCGKSTAIRILAGLEHPTGGTVRIGGSDVTALETRRRDMGLVTQSNLLLAHRTARRNIQFPLEVGERRVEPVDPRERVEAEAEALGVTHLLERDPGTLSEGEKRLVQLARAIITSPSTLLLDEPMMYLEDRVRSRLRRGILRVHRTRRLTTVMVTASQHDAMAMSDRIGVLFNGVVHQVGTPQDVYARPATADVARFFGEPAMNVVPASVHVEGSQRTLEVFGRRVAVATPLVDIYDRRSVLVGIRPHDFVLGERQTEGIAATVDATEPLGQATLATMQTAAGDEIRCTIPGGPLACGTVLDLGLRADRFHLFDPATGLAIMHPIGPG